MGFRTGSYAKVWKVEPKSDRVTDLRISVSKKNKESGEYEQDFGGYVRCVGAACASKAASLSEGSRIRLGDVDVTRRFDKDAQKEYTNFTVFAFETEDEAEAEEEPKQEKAPPSDPDPKEPSEETLPF